jgi:hypothetical protein
VCVNVFIVNILCVRYVALSLSDFTLINITLISNQQQCSTIRSSHSSSSSSTTSLYDDDDDDDNNNNDE